MERNIKGKQQYSSDNNKTNHPMLNNNHPSPTANKARHCLKWSRVTKPTGHHTAVKISLQTKSYACTIFRVLKYTRQCHLISLKAKVLSLVSWCFNRQKKEEIRLSPMSPENKKVKKQNKDATITLITQRLRADLGRSVQLRPSNWCG